jgi:SAM-dependent methyltransferase
LKVLPSSIKYVLKRIIAFWARIRLTVGVAPLSHQWGFDRGKPIHRYYLEQFLQEFSADIRGHCLEFQEDSYTNRFGKAAVIRTDILHIDESNPKATIVADLTRPNHIASNLFDCIICTHVLHMIFDLDTAIAEIYRILKPGGVLLIAVPHISKFDPRFHEIWRFTPEGLNLVLAKAFNTADISVRSYGNSLTAAADLRGVVTHEFRKSVLDRHDTGFAVEVCARAVKS